MVTKGKDQNLKDLLRKWIKKILIWKCMHNKRQYFSFFSIQGSATLDVRIIAVKGKKSSKLSKPRLDKVSSKKILKKKFHSSLLSWQISFKLDLQRNMICSVSTRYWLTQFGQISGKTELQFKHAETICFWFIWPLLSFIKLTDQQPQHFTQSRMETVRNAPPSLTAHRVRATSLKNNGKCQSALSAMLHSEKK